ncbi:hypothetical protein V0R50_13170 [Pseudomonas sp. 148P]|uniref:Uncharacterized protein n=1 Tax=Pseudomonas ulcerans TaxID=3115852 RepID=A0ABU7HRM0_9PSED|nr:MULTISPECIES: hypothetical protein [unclassified Pseudomonas]MEE1923216.1 hypothetical protein [Pseudomonas sp. 147P]MEE1934178.1 hypothetical protein [Pseudomonas sp. 148P]
MDDSPRKSPQGLQASVTAVLGTFATASCMKWLPAEHAQYWVGASTLIVPIVGYCIAKIFYRIDESEGLTQYKARLRRDIKSQKKILKDKYVSEAVKEGVRSKYEATILKLASANQDYTAQGIIVEQH